MVLNILEQTKYLKIKNLQQLAIENECDHMIVLFSYLPTETEFIEFLTCKTFVLPLCLWIQVSAVGNILTQISKCKFELSSGI